MAKPDFEWVDYIIVMFKEWLVPPGLGFPGGAEHSGQHAAAAAIVEAYRHGWRPGSDLRHSDKTMIAWYLCGLASWSAVCCLRTGNPFYIQVAMIAIDCAIPYEDDRDVFATLVRVYDAANRMAPVNALSEIEKYPEFRKYWEKLDSHWKSKPGWLPSDPTCLDLLLADWYVKIVHEDDGPIYRSVPYRG